MTQPNFLLHRPVESTFEEIRLKEFPDLPSRKFCIFLFNLSLDPDSYARSMEFIVDDCNLVEIEILDDEPKIARVNKSLLFHRIKNRKLKASRPDIIADAREYWSGLTQVS